jgi:D-alanyl-D-alanine dipeptidase
MDIGLLGRRMAEAQQLMDQRNVDFLFVSPSSDLVYLFDYPAHTSERLALLILPRSGKAQLVVPTLERSRSAGRESLVDIHTWNETEQPVEVVRDIVRSVNGPTIGVSDQMWSVFLVRMLESIPDANFVIASPIMRELRMTKDAAELDALKRAAEMADAAWTEFATTASIAGMTEREAATALSALRAKHGLEVTGIGICASGPNSANPHHSTGGRVIQQGDAVVFDFGGKYQHYTADVTRTVYIGEPDDEYRKVYNIVLQANQATLEAIRSGAACQDIDRAARKVITDAGYGEYFIHRVGHGLGLDGHEEPYLVEGNTLKLKEGMVFSDEPGIYIAGKFGVRVEDAVVVTADGGIRINHCDRELTVMS